MQKNEAGFFSPVIFINGILVLREQSKAAADKYCVHLVAAYGNHTFGILRSPGIVC
jgi:hypothetical protein